MQTLVIDQTLPNSDPFRSTSNGGRVRYITAEDALTLATFNRVFGDVVYRTNLIISKVNEVVGAINERQSAGDASRNILSNGTVPFLRPQRGVDPTNESHLATKRYVDAADTVLSGRIETVSSQFEAFKGTSPASFQSGWVTYTWQAGTRSIVDLALGAIDSKVLDTSSVTGIAIIERLDIAVPTTASPNPPAEYVYRHLTPGSNGFAVEDLWLIASSRTVRVLVPNISNYDSGYLNSGYDKLQTPRSRALKAVVTGASTTA